jgi:hypothetical protein
MAIDEAHSILEYLVLEPSLKDKTRVHAAMHPSTYSRLFFFNGSMAFIRAPAGDAPDPLFIPSGCSQP